MSGLAANTASGANALRERLTLERPDFAPDEVGGSEPQWQAVATVWASIRLCGEPQIQLSGNPCVNVVSWRIRIRYRKDVQPGMRFCSCNGGSPPRIYSVLAVSDEDGRRRFLQCVCEERS